MSELLQQDRLFETLKDLNPRKVLELYWEYRKIFKYQKVDDETLSADSLPFNNTEGLTFEPDRLVAMCSAVQDAVSTSCRLGIGGYLCC